MNKNFIVRQAVISDAKDIYYINKTSLGYDYDLEKQKGKIEAVLNDSTQVIFVAETNNKVVGYIHLVNYDVIYADNFKNCLGLAVDNDYKRNGIGSALLNQAEIWAKEKGNFICLEPWEGRTDDHEFAGTIDEKIGATALEAGESRKMQYSMEFHK